MTEETTTELYDLFTDDTNLLDNDTELTSVAPAICDAKSVYYVNRQNISPFISQFVILTIIVFLGLIGNTLSYILMHKDSKGSSSTFILKVLSVADNLVLIFHFLYFSLPACYAYTGTPLGYKKFHELFAKCVFGIVMWSSKVMSIYFTLLVTVERYIAVSRPLRAPFVCTLKNARIGTLCVVLFSVIYNLPKVLYYPVNNYAFDPCLGEVAPVALSQSRATPIWFQQVYITYLYLGVIYAFPLLTLTMLNFYLIAALRASSKMRCEMAAGTKKVSPDRITEKIIGIVTAFILLESPAIVVNLMMMISPKAVSRSMKFNFLYTTYILSTVNSVINFYIYCLLGKRFRQQLLMLLGCVRTKRKPGSFKTTIATPSNGTVSTITSTSSLARDGNQVKQNVRGEMYTMNEKDDSTKL